MEVLIIVSSLFGYCLGGAVTLGLLRRAGLHMDDETFALLFITWPCVAVFSAFYAIYSKVAGK